MPKYKRRKLERQEEELPIEELVKLYERAEVGHPLQGKDLYTPVTDEMLELLVYLKGRYGTWRALCAAIGIKTRVLRKIRNGGNATVSMTLWDKVLIATGLEYSLQYYTWFTAEDLIKLGLWKPTPILERRGNTLKVIREKPRELPKTQRELARHKRRAS